MKLERLSKKELNNTYGGIFEYEAACIITSTVMAIDSAWNWLVDTV